MVLDIRGYMGGKTDSILEGKGNLAGDLYVSEEYQASSAVIFIIANDVRYQAIRGSSGSGHFVIENIPCGKWPIVVEIRRKYGNTRRHERFQGTTCISSQFTTKDVLYIPSMAVIVKGQA
jgi:hypothetical protein